MKLYSYVLRFDDGAAPNPFWDSCTLAICKPVIRRTASIGDWVVGTGSKGYCYPEIQNCIVYAMKISDIMTFERYDNYCQESLSKKIPKWQSKSFPERMGDCIYGFSGSDVEVREGVHNIINRDKDLSGKNVLLSNHFYYFGDKPVLLEESLKPIIKQNQGHKKIESPELIRNFESWISQYELNKLYGNPQLMDQFSEDTSICKNTCKGRLDDEEEDYLVIC